MTTGLCLKRQSQGESELVVQGPQCDQLTGRQENISDPSQVAAPGSQLQEALPISPAEFRGKEQGHCGTAGCPHTELGNAAAGVISTGLLLPQSGPGWGEDSQNGEAGPGSSFLPRESTQSLSEHQNWVAGRDVLPATSRSRESPRT